MEEYAKEKAASWFLGFLNELTGDLADQLWQYFASLFMAPLSILEDPLITALQRSAVAVAMGMMPVLVGFMVLQRLGRVMDGTSSTPPEAIVRRTITAGIAVGSISLWGWVSVTFTNLLMEIIGAFGLDINWLQPFFKHQAVSLTLAVLMLVFLLAATLLWLQGGLLAVEFSLLMIGGPLAALSLLFDDQPEPWQAWKRQLIAVCLTRVVQMAILLIFVRRYADVAEPTGGQLLESIGWMVAVWMQPRWIRSFTATTGMSTFVQGAARSAVQVAVLRQARLPMKLPAGPGRRGSHLG